jgi:AAA domain, putative AbiEii toxin, Type IV TA system
LVFRRVAPSLSVLAVTGRHFGIREVSIRGYRSALSVSFSPGPVCALVGGPNVGKSNVLAAIRLLLARGEPAPRGADVSRARTAPIELSATLADGDEITLEADPGGATRGSGPAVPVLFIPAALRAGRLIDKPTGSPDAEHIARRYFEVGEGISSATPATALLAGVGALCEAREGGLVLMIEEPELFLRPQAQRYLYRLLRRFASHGNQVLYSTHEPAFLNVGRLDELALVEHSPGTGTRVIQPEPLDAGESFRALSELDAERGELFLARSVLLVEGRTEKLTLPFVFRALGYDADQEAITIVDCGGKPNIPLFLRICRTARVPCVAIHDRDAPPGRRPSHSERLLNAEISSLAGTQSTFTLAPDFEAVAGLRGHRHKPARAWQLFSRMPPAEVPVPLARAVQRAIELARA